jgi:hypothetical protein
MRALVAVVWVSWLGCGPTGGGSAGAGGSATGGTGGDATGGAGGGGVAGSGAGGSGGGPILPNTCPSGQPLPSLSGTVYAPNGTDPLPGALVYVPMGALPPLPPSGTCDACATVPNAFVQTHSGAAGLFAFDRVPAGNIQVVIQMGRFRRAVSLMAPCGQAVHLSADQSRLPRSHTEGDVPRVAIATGSVDRMEDVIAKIGLDDVDLYQGKSPAPSGNNYPMLDALLMDGARLASYDIVLINCHNSFERLLMSGPTVGNVAEFVRAGGRLFVDDLSYEFVEWPFPAAIDFEPDPSGNALMSTVPQGALDAAEIGTGGTTAMPSAPVTATVMDDDLRTWLSGFPGTLAADGSVSIQGWLHGWAVMHAVPPQTKVWVEGNVSWTGGSGTRPLSVGLDYKGIDGMGCGRIVFNSYHTVPLMSSPTSPFLPQERILEYLFFQIATCIQIG